MRINRDIYIFVGPPGCGKGTLSALCVKEFGWAQLSTGNMCRKHIVEQTEIGKKIDFVIKSGKLISDSLIADLVENELNLTLDDCTSVILDGFPRTEPQAKLLLEIYKELNLTGLTVVRFKVDDAIVFNRLANRLVCSNKDCQAVYSLSSQSSLLPKVEGVCDKCSSALYRREDDKDEVILKRLKEYEKQENLIIDFFREQGFPVYELDVNRPVQEVFLEFKRLIGKQ